MERLDAQRVAEAILTAPGWARDGITAPTSHIRVAAANELARTILEDAGREGQAPLNDQPGLAL